MFPPIKVLIKKYPDPGDFRYISVQGSLEKMSWLNRQNRLLLFIIISIPRNGEHSFALFLVICGFCNSGPCYGERRVMPFRL